MIYGHHVGSGLSVAHNATDPSREGEAHVSLVAVDRQLAALWPTSVRLYRPRTVLFQQGDRVEYVYLLIRGTIKFSFVYGSGHEVISLMRSDACALGADAALLGVPSLVAATTLCQCKIRSIPAEPIRKMLRNDADLSFHMSRLMAFESLNHTMAIINSSSGNARDRLINFLRQQQAGVGKASDAAPASATILRKHEIAKLLAITPEHLSRIVKRLAMEGIVEDHHKTIALRRPNTIP
jgi:CRP-like cAMP-binding protein